jgi:predicted ATP-binding protein involved in virulence
MLTKFAVTNFRGFRRRIELDLTRHRDYEFNSFAISNEIVKNGIIYGPNGSGKSNFSLAIFDIVNHLSQKWKDFGYYANFANAAAANDEVRFEYGFKFGDTVVDYSYAKTSEGVLCSELLAVNGVQKFKRTKGKFEIDTDEFQMDEAVGRKLAANANAVSVVNYLLVSYPFAEGHYLIRLRNFVDGMLWFRNLDERLFIGLDTGIKLIYAEIIHSFQASCIMLRMLFNCVIVSWSA